jgi:hypothetical protein
MRPVLAALHLSLLGLLAVLHDIRPAGGLPQLPSEYVIDPTATHQQQSDDYERRKANVRDIMSKYAAWLGSQLATYTAVADSIGHEAMVHLDSVAAIRYAVGVPTKLWTVLDPPSADQIADAPFAHASERQAYAERMAGQLAFGAQTLEERWISALQFAELTPAGVLIGLSVHDLKSGSTAAEEYEWAARSTRVPIVVYDHQPGAERRREIEKIVEAWMREQATSARLRRGDIRLPF